MNQIQFRCDRCRRRIGIDLRMAGRRVPCPGCGAEMIVPQSAERRGGRERHRRRYYELSTDGNEEGQEAPFQLGRRRGEIEEMDLTPMVDVTFLLLIFFMITASFSMQKTLEVPPPDPQTKGASPIPLERLEENSVIVRVAPRDQFFVDGKPLDDPDDLVYALSEAMANGNRSELVIEADDAARYGSVVQVYDAGNEVGMQRIRLADPVSQ